MKLLKYLAAVCIIALMSKSATATPIMLDVLGSLQNGGSISGTVTYQSDATDIGALTFINEFRLSAWDVTVDTGDPSTSFQLVSTPSGSGIVARVTNGSTFINAIQLSDDIFTTNGILSVHLLMVFDDLTNGDMFDAPPIATSFGNSIAQYTVGNFGFDSRYGYSDSNTGFIDAVNATALPSITIPEPGAIALLCLGLAGLCASRRKRYS